MPKKTASEDRDWVQQGLLIPRTLREMFRQEVGSKTLGVKRLGTASIALFLGAPDHVQDALVKWIDLAANDHPDDITPEHAWEVFKAAVVSEGAKRMDDDGPSRWFIDRILDPELTPPPGQKASDREAARGDEEQQRKAQ